MADASAADPGTRGTLTIRNKAAARITERAALDVPGVVRSGGRLGTLAGRALPRAIVDMTLAEPNIRVDIAVEWPMPIAAVCEQVQRRVVADLQRYTDRHPSRVDVAVGEVIAVGNAEGVAEIVAHAHVAADSPTPPLGRPAATYTVIAIGLLLLGLAVVSAREFLIVHNDLGGPAAIAPILDWVARTTWQPWFLPAAIGVSCLGAALVVAAVWPRRRTHAATSGTPRLWLRTTDIARLSTAAALHVDGVKRAVTDASFRNARVRVVPDGRNPQVETVVRDAVAAALIDLERPPSVRVVAERAG